MLVTDEFSYAPTGRESVQYHVQDGSWQRSASFAAATYVE
jgi:hypothetical protein